MKFKAKAKDFMLIVKAKASFGESIDEKELDRFSRVYMRGFLKPKLIKKNQIEYKGPVGISLYERLKKGISKRDLMFIIEQFVVAVQKLKANHMNIEHMVMNIEHAYINEITKEVQFIYVPTVKGIANSSIIEFIEAITYSVKPINEEDCDFVSRFIYFIKAMAPFDINKVELFIEKEDTSVVQTIKKQNIGQSGFMTNKPQHYYDHYEAKKQEDDEATTLLIEEEPTELLSENEEETGLLSDLDDEATGLLSEEEQSIHFPTIYRVFNDETIRVNKEVFRIGKEKSCVDYFVENNVTVSRNHADIITRGNRYFVKDLNSKNRTYINNIELPVQTEVEIHDGDYLTLANEEFIFYL